MGSRSKFAGGRGVKITLAMCMHHCQSLPKRLPPKEAEERSASDEDIVKYRSARRQESSDGR